MPGATVRWRGLRRRGTFPDPPRDLPQWEAQILDALGSLATVSAERWVMAGPVSGSSGSAIQAAMGCMQPGWLLRVAPTSLTCDLALPDLGREGAGRMIAVQHSGASRSALRLGWGGSYIAACTSPGHIAMCVWDGEAWKALAGRVEWADVKASAQVPIASAASPVSQQYGNWSENLYTFPRGSDSYAWFHVRLPPTWIATDVMPEVLVVPLVAANGTALFSLLWAWLGIGAAPPLANWAAAPPTSSAQTGLQVVVTAAGGTFARRIPASAIGTGVSVLSTLDASVMLSVQRTGSSGSDTYTATYAGTANNLALLDVMLRAQVCAVGMV